MFKFLKLHSSSSGDARRHVPFASIIHKHIFPVFFVTILFLTLFFRPYAAEALAQLTPEIQPVYDTTITNLYEFVKVQLDDTNKQVFDLLLGSYMVGYAGMANYKLNYVYSSDQPVKEWLINSGADLYNTILSLGGIAPEGSTNLSGVPNIGFQQLSPLIQVAMGCAIKSKSYSDVNDALNDITTSDNYPIPLNVDIMSSLNAAMGYYGGLYDWQFQPINFSVWTYKDNYYSNLSNSNKNSYNNFVSTMTNPTSVNMGYIQYIPSNPDELQSCKIDFDFSTVFNRYHNIFIDTGSRYVRFYDDDGIQWTGSYTTVNAIACFTNSYFTFNGQVKPYNNAYDSNLSYDTIIQSIMSYEWYPLYFGGNIYIQIPLAVYNPKFYYGTSWGTKQEYNAESDKNLDVPDEPTFYKGVIDGLLDLKGLLEDLLDQNELKPPVINNYYYPDGDPVPVSDMEPAYQNNELPDSGVDIDQDLFSPLFYNDGKKSYISYLWYMTKPLILYTRDLFDCLIFDPVEDFAASGPGYFVYGVVSLGLISGLLVKCLL